ncbi:MAG TPA: YceI family protein [Chryseolinea sp.]|nr:YceI family protein [Chryseolinea sp.]
MMKRIMLLLACSFAAISATWCQPGDLKITEIFPVDAAHSYIGFSIKYMGYAMVRGRFTDFRGAVRYDEKDAGKTSVSLMVKVASIDTGDKWRDDDLKSSNWFDTAAYPEILFVSKKSEVTSNGLLVTGDLTMHGITRSIVIPLNAPIGVVRDVRRDSQVIFTGALTINRIDFGVEGKKWAGIKEGITAVSDDVNIELTILAKRINADNFKYWVADVSTPHGQIYNAAKTAGIEKALGTFDALRTAPNQKLDEEALNTAGQMLLKEGKVKEALALFKKNVEVCPQASVVYESYAEGLATLGKWNEALKFYRVAIEKDKDNMNAREVVRLVKN